MRPEDFSRTHWIVIGLLLGLVGAFVRVNFLPTPGQTHTLATLERDLFRQPQTGSDGKEYPWIQKIVVYPGEDLAMAPTPGRQPTMAAKMVVVTFEVRTADLTNKKWQWTPAVIHLREPVDPVARRLDEPNLTVTGYLDEIAQATGRGKLYTYAWWAEPKWAYITWTAMGVVLIGGLWPLAQELLIRAGWGSRSAERKPSLWQQWKAYRQDSAARRARAARAASASASTSSSAAGRPAGGANSLSDDEMARLNAMEADLHEFLASGSQPASEADGADAASSAPAVRQLNAGPLETAKPQEQAPQGEKSYGGTFYPTAAHGHGKKPTEAPGKGEAEGDEKDH